MLPLQAASNVTGSRLSSGEQVADNSMYPADSGPMLPQQKK
jgi:hypothetical protein